MTIAKTVEHSLERYAIPYSVISHAPTLSSLAAATATAVPARNVAKAVVLGDEYGYLMAVLPADRIVDVQALAHALDRPHLNLVSENRLARLFDDCELGAVPPLGSCYGIETVVDDRLLDEHEIYFESGDHNELIRVRRDDFLLLIGGAHHGHLSRRPSMTFFG